MELYEKDNYVANYSSIISSYIREYDISKANINILKESNCITDDLYNYLLLSPKTEREIYVGKMIRYNNQLSNVLKNGFLNARKNLFESNQIDSFSVLSIKKDAVYLIDKVLEHTQFGLINFKLANVYTSFYKIGNLELYYGKELLHVKGINDNNIKKYHNDYIYDLLLYIFEMAEDVGVVEVLLTLNQVLEKYKNLELEIGYYREFNANSKYRLNFNSITYGQDTIGLEYIEDTYENKKALNISYNYNFLCELYRIYLTRYFSQK